MIGDQTAETATMGAWVPGDKLQVTSTLDRGVARRFVAYCQENERNGASTIRLAVRKLLEGEGH